MPEQVCLTRSTLIGIWCHKADTAGDSSLHEQTMIRALFQFPIDALPEISVTIAKSDVL